MNLGIYHINGVPVTGGESPAFPTQIVTADALDTSKYLAVTTIDGWAQYGPGMVKSAAGFMDWKCLRSKIRELVMAVIEDSWTNFVNLNPAQKLVACQYLPDEVPKVNFNATVAAEDSRTLIKLAFFINSRAARDLRFQMLITYAYAKLEIADVLEVVDDISSKLRVSYAGGVESYAQSGKSGLVDYLDGINDYSATGLPSKSFTPLVVGEGQTAAEALRLVCDGMLGIVVDGNYSVPALAFNLLSL